MRHATIDSTEHDSVAVIQPSGPLAPYRFALSLGFAAVVAGQPLAAAIEGGAGLEQALIRAFAAGAVMWFPTGLINRLLIKGALPVDQHEAPDSDA